MINKNRSKIVISSIIVLLPMLFGVIMWDELPAMMTTHWGADGNADGVSGKAFTVFGLPFIFLILHVFSVLFTLSDKKQKDQDPKALGIVFWIIPAVSLVVNGMMYRTALGGEFRLELLLPALFGLMFIFIGNYLPKVKQNRTLGIKIPWTLNNEENWNKTHRLGGKVWFCGGIMILLSLFLPIKVMLPTMVVLLAVIFIVPVVYSYCIYRQDQKMGVVYAPAAKSKSERISAMIAAAFGGIILIAAAVLMFTGDIEVQCKDTAFQIHATYWTDLEMDYAAVDSIEYRRNLDAGVRTNGFGSVRLSLGNFQNDEFGSYTLYAYTDAKAFLVLTADEKILVIGMKDEKDTQTIYRVISEKTAPDSAKS